MKKYFLLFTPPIVVVACKRIAHTLRQIKLRANRPEINNYNDDSLTEMVVKKNSIFRDELKKNKTIDLTAIRTVLGVCIAGLESSGRTINVLDLGGGGGFHYFIARSVLPGDLHVNWHVVETESMVRSAGILANEELKFFSSIHGASKGIEQFDILFASSSFQYFSDQTELIDQLLTMQSKAIYVTRTPFSSSEPVVGEKQVSLFSANGPGPLPDGYQDKLIEYPIYIMRLNEFIQRFSDRYDIRFKVREETAGFTINGRSYDNYGIYFTLKEQPAAFPGRSDSQ